MPRREQGPYKGAWPKVRLAILDRDKGLCRFPFEDGSECLAPATSVDHIVPVREAPWLRLEPSNLRAACTKHNEGRVKPRLLAMAEINRRAAPVRQW